jgi:UDP-N-acetylglucosamine 2-epimerase (non-hydrolysing)
MPEEINRIVTDTLSDLLLVSEPSGIENLRREGIENGKAHLVGNVMIDTLVRELPRALDKETYSRYGLNKKEYALLTLHRPSNVDDSEILGKILDVVIALSNEIPVIFPAHPRTRKFLTEFHLENLLEEAENVHLISPLPYHDNLCLMANAKVVLTDSGGMQEETSYLRVPCLTLRDNTERPVTVALGTSRLVGNDPAKIEAGLRDIINGSWPEGRPIPLWDGQASKRIAKILMDFVA